MKDRNQEWAFVLAFLLLLSCGSEAAGEGDKPDEGGGPGDGGASGGASSGGTFTGGAASGGASGSGGETAESGGAPASGGREASGGSGGEVPGSGGEGTGGADGCAGSEAAETMTFFVTSYHHMKELSGSVDGFGGDLRYGGAETGLEGADAICQEIARRVCHGEKTWRAFLSTSTVDARDRIGSGPWHDYTGALVAADLAGLLGHDRPAGGCCDAGMYDELGTFHDGHSDVNDDGIDDDDHDVITASNLDGTYAGFSCDDWTTTQTNVPQGEFILGVQFGHMWPASSGASWVTAHAGFGCGAGTNFIQGAVDSASIGGGGGYGALYCFAVE